MDAGENRRAIKNDRFARKREDCHARDVTRKMEETANHSKAPKEIRGYGLFPFRGDTWLSDAINSSFVSAGRSHLPQAVDL